MYHMISAPQTTAETRYACPPKQFEKHLQQLLKSGYIPVNIDQVNKFYTANIPLPDKAVLITLDDGFEDNYHNAFPILRRYNIPAVIYLATGVIAKTNLWMNSPTYSERKMLSWSQIKEMSSQGIQFGSHTVSHPKLNELDDDIAIEELVQSKKAIDDNLGIECSHFAYPFGQFTGRTRELVLKAGYKTACTTRSGFNNAAKDPLMLHRIEVYGNDSTWKLQQKITFGTNDITIPYLLRYYYNRYIDKVKIFTQ